MRVFLLRPPRYLWSFNSPASAFWPPLGPLRVVWALRQFLLRRDARKRRVSLSLFKRGTEVAVHSLCHSRLGSHRSEPVSYSRKPSWYDT